MAPRVLAWNIRGQLSSLEVGPRAVHLMQNHDILALSHTGILGPYDAPYIEGFTCLSCQPRPFMSKDGGVALYYM